MGKQRHLSRVLLVAAALMAMAHVGSPAAAGQSSPTCFGKRPTIVGTDEKDTLRGTPGRDVIVGLGARDKIFGRGGNDLLCGRGDGYKSSQNDFGDTLRGGAGDDKLDSDHGDDYEYGGPGDDYLFSGGGSQSAFGDYLSGGPGDDRLVGGAVPETFAPGAGNDRVKGGKGKDYEYDMLDLTDAPHGVRVSVGSHIATGQGKDRFEGIERFYGSRFDDVFLGDGRRNTFSGGKGNDVLRGRGGDDFVDGDRMGVRDQNVGGGRDRVFGGSGLDGVGTGGGRDKLVGGKGKDGFYVYGDGEKRVIAGHQAHQSLQFYFGPVRADVGAGKATVKGDTHASIEFTGITDIYGSAESDVLLGDRHDNLLRAYPNTYTLPDADAPGDVIRGGGGDDTIIDMFLASSLFGGTGDDSITGDDGDDTIEGGAGDDEILAGVEYESEYSDDDDAGGGPGNDEIDGGFGDDRLDGDAGRDEVRGGPGTDTCTEAETRHSCEA